MTNSDYEDQSPEFEHEYSQGKNQFDAATAAGNDKVDNLEVKACVTAYGRSLASSIKIFDIQPGAYFTNYTLQSPSRPSPQRIHLRPCYVEDDYGKYVVGPLEYALGGEREERWKEMRTVHAAMGYITPDEMCQAFSQVSGKKVTYIAIPDPQLHAIVQSFAGSRAAGRVIEMYRGIREVGYYGGDDLKPNNAHLAKPADTFWQTLKARPEVIKKIFEGEA
ncbi:hypothetical protein NliqN6_5951 [Naganishia liquefaciens]|uniref:NmrA-like domain-containing protein n=1 Tax=Naganishia liquefaciens TaxID=104408 RepID=A0A8H3TYQ1_9TREE|nr:hypothetical protein NliqN6_5951 [Naganishia liquefaciens]